MTRERRIWPHLLWIIRGEGSPPWKSWVPWQSLFPLQPLQYSQGGGSYPVPYLGSSHYPYQRIAPQASADGHQPLFPKPIYSYRYISSSPRAERGGVSGPLGKLRHGILSV